MTFDALRHPYVVRKSQAGSLQDLIYLMNIKRRGLPRHATWLEHVGRIDHVLPESTHVQRVLLETIDSPCEWPR
jgi:hypothetical protein